MKNIRYMLILIMILFIPTIVSAFTKMEASTQSPIVNDYVYVRVNLDYGADKEVKEMHFKVSYDTSALELTDQPMWTQSRSSNGEYTIEDGAVRVDKTGASANWKSGAVIQIKLKVLKPGQTVIRVSREGDAYYGDGNVIPHENSSSITLYAKEPNSNVQLRSLIVEGYYLNPVFSAYKREYNLDVPANEEYINIIVERGDPTQIIEGDEIRKLNYGLNYINVVVKAQSGATDTYSLKIKRADNRTGDTSLKELSVTNSDLVYEEGKTEFTTTVSRSVDNVILSARAKDPNATLIGTGRKQLEIGDNYFTLKVSSSNGLETEYKINIIRSAEEYQQVNKSSKLQNLKVNGIVFDLSKEQYKFYYSVYNDVNELDITTITESKTAKVEITGNESLKEGTNRIEIKVKENDDTETLYTIIVYKNPNAEKLKDLANADYYSNSIYETSTPNIIPKAVIDKINANNVTLHYNVVNMYGGLLYQVSLKNNLVGDINPEIKKVEGNGVKYESNIPADNQIVLYLEEKFKDGSDVKLTSMDEEGHSKVITEGIRVIDGYVTFTSNGDKYYVFTPSSPVVRRGILGKYSEYIAGGFIIVFLACVIIYFNKSKKKKEPVQKEPLY